MKTPCSRHPAPANFHQQLDNFRDVWELQSDSDFASEFYRKSASPPPTPQGSILCSNCKGYDVWTPMFFICERLVDIKTRSQTCELCALLVQSAELLGMEDGHELKCRREGSSLKIDPDGPTILSLYVNPGKYRKEIIRIVDRRYLLTRINNSDRRLYTSACTDRLSYPTGNRLP